MSKPRSLALLIIPYMPVNDTQTVSLPQGTHLGPLLLQIFNKDCTVVIVDIVHCLIYDEICKKSFLSSMFHITLFS